MDELQVNTMRAGLQHEQQDAEEMILGMEKNSLCLYDRLYLCNRL